jgi:hypothetical protein
MGNLPPTVRFPFNLDPDSYPEGEPQEKEHGWKRLANQAVRYVFSGLLDAQQAIAALNKKIGAASTSSASPSGGNVIGAVNDQTGQAAYTVQNADYGALVIVNNGAGVQIGLNALVERPYYVRIKVDSGSGAAILTPTNGTINHAGFIVVAPGTTVQANINSADVNWSAS